MVGDVVGAHEDGDVHPLPEDAVRGRLSKGEALIDLVLDLTGS